MKVLAIDPGYDRCGVAVIEKEGYKSRGKEVLLFSQCITTEKSENFEKRLTVVGDACWEIIKKYKPNAIVLEKIYFSKNQKTALKIAEVCGVITYLATRAHIPLFEYTPSEVKSAVTSFGGADKRQVALMVRALIVINKKIEYDDEYDAIALGLTYFSRIVAIKR